MDNWSDTENKTPYSFIACAKAYIYSVYRGLKQNELRGRKKSKSIPLDQPLNPFDENIK